MNTWYPVLRLMHTAWHVRPVIALLLVTAATASAQAPVADGFVGESIANNRQPNRESDRSRYSRRYYRSPLKHDERTSRPRYRSANGDVVNDVALRTRCYDTIPTSFVFAL